VEIVPLPVGLAVLVRVHGDISRVSNRPILVHHDYPAADPFTLTLEDTRLALHLYEVRLLPGLSGYL